MDCKKEEHGEMKNGVCGIRGKDYCVRVRVWVCLECGHTDSKVIST